jgi:hypothetical protein
MKNAVQLQEALERYHRLCQEVEVRKYHLVGGQSFPVKDQDWQAWKDQEPWRTNLEIYPAPPPDSCDDPDYYKLLTVYEEMFDTWCNITGIPDFDQADEAVIKDVINSFPSLHGVAESLNLWGTLYQILDRGESIDPQAYYAAHFVDALYWHGRDGQWTDRKFYVDRAFDVWDQIHKEAFIHWTTMPFFPLSGFYEPSVTPPPV